MYIYLEFRWNRPVDFDEDYISPGSFTIVLRNGEKRQFDFCMNEQGHIDEDRSKTYVKCMDLDSTYEDGDKLLLSDLANIDHIEEIFIGVSNEHPKYADTEALNVVEILNISAEDSWPSSTLGRDIIQKVEISPDLYDVLSSVYVDHNI